MNKPVDYSNFDEVLVDRIVAGRPARCPIPAADAAEAVRRLAVMGYSDGQIAVRLGFTRRSVQRIRTKRDIPAALTATGDNEHTRLHDAPTRPRLAG